MPVNWLKGTATNEHLFAKLYDCTELYVDGSESCDSKTFYAQNARIFWPIS